MRKQKITGRERVRAALEALGPFCTNSAAREWSLKKFGLGITNAEFYAERQIAQNGDVEELHPIGSTSLDMFASIDYARSLITSLGKENAKKLIDKLA